MNRPPHVSAQVTSITIVRGTSILVAALAPRVTGETVLNFVTAPKAEAWQTFGGIAHSPEARYFLKL